MTRLDLGNGLGPEFFPGTIGVHWKILPGFFEDFIQDQHRHVASDRITLPGYLTQNLDHGLSRGGGSIVDLQRVGPGWEIRIASMSQEAASRLGLHFHAPGTPLFL